MPRNLDVGKILIKPVGPTEEGAVRDFLPAEIGVFGGTGLYDPELFEDTLEVKIYTPYGEPSDTFTMGQVTGKKVVFLARHNRYHSIPPHKINVRANVWAMKSLGVQRIISPAACGTLQPETVLPGEFVVCDQIFDRTFGQRSDTFFEGGIVGHVPFSDPYCSELRQVILDIGRDLDLKTHRGDPLRIHDSGVMVVINGPRFSTRAESLFYKGQGFTVVGMTAYPETVLCREAEICLANISMPTDADVYGLEPVNAQMVVESMKRNIVNIKRLLYAVIPEIPIERHCDCGTSLDVSLY
ncbi:MAG: MTAP family purine nucleoside phosphorylase [Candidatus Hodarchaeota archaeon]